MFPCPRTCLRVWSRETGSAVPSRVSLLILHTQAESGAYLLPSSAAASIYLFKTAIRPRVSPYYSFSGHAVAYRWRSLPRVRWHKSSKPPGSSERVLLPWQFTMDQLTYASLFLQCSSFCIVVWLYDSYYRVLITTVLYPIKLCATSQ